MATTIITNYPLRGLKIGQRLGRCWLLRQRSETEIEVTDWWWRAKLAQFAAWLDRAGAAAADSANNDRAAGKNNPSKW